MRFTKLLAAIWRESKGFLLVLAVVAVVYFNLYRPGRTKPAPAITNSPPAVALSTNTASTNKLPKVEGVRVSLSTNPPATNR